MKKFRQRLQYFGLAIGGILLLYQLRSGFVSLQEKDIQLTFSSPILIAFLATIAAIVLQMFAWSNAMRCLGAHIPHQDVMKGYLLAFLPRYIPGTIWGYISRGEWLYQNHQIDYRVSNQGSILETLSAIVANLMIVGLASKYMNSPSWFLVLAAVILFPFVIWALVQFAAGLPVQKFGRLAPVIQFLFPRMHLGYWLLSIIFFLFVWAFYGFGLMMVSQSLLGMHALIGFGPLLQFSNIYALAWLFGFFIIFAPTGLGFRELALTNLLANTLGIAFGQGSILAIVFRLVILLTELICLGISLLFKRNDQRKGFARV